MRTDAAMMTKIQMLNILQEQIAVCQQMAQIAERIGLHGIAKGWLNAARELENGLEVEAMPKKQK